jgi:predicted ATPase
LAAFFIELFPGVCYNSCGGINKQMLKEFHLKNFKSWADTKPVHLAPLTGFFGANSSGKTSLLQALLMLKQTVESTDRKRPLNTGDDRSFTDLGNILDIIYGHNHNQSIGIQLSWGLSESEYITANDPEKKDEKLFDVKGLHFETIIGEEESGAVTRKFSYSLDNRMVFGMEKEKQNYRLLSKNYKPKRIRGRGWPLPAPVKCYGFPDEVFGYYQNLGFLNQFVLAFEYLFKHVAYLGPLREYPHRSYLWTQDSPEDVGRKGELAIPALLASAQKPISNGKGVRPTSIGERVSHWLKEMKLIDSYELKPIAPHRHDYEMKVKKNPVSPEVFITDVGFGVSQVLPVVVLCYHMPEGSIILLEQPEIHLHPSVQAALADLFIEVVSRRDIQIILESHSEHLLRRIQRRIAERSIDSGQVSLYFCKMEKDASNLEKLQMDEFGNISNWPPDFFGDELGDSYALLQAEMARTRA